MIKKMSIPALFLCLLSLSFPGPSHAISLPGGLTIVNTLSPSGMTSGSIVILNNDEESRTVRVYQTDYTFSSDGKSNFAKPGSTPRSNASWIAYSPNQAVIPPHGKAEIYYRVAVPNDPGLCGTYWSVCMVEPVPETALTPPNPEKKKTKVSVQTVFRHAIQMVTNIGDTGTRSLKFADKKLEIKKGRTFLILDVKNTGERWLVPTIYVDLHDQNGQQPERYNGGKLRIYPGCSVRYTVDLGPLKPQTYNALIIADNGGDETIFGARYVLEVR